MGKIAIVRPLPFTVGGTMAGASRVATPDPKEAAVATSAGSQTIDIDLGSVQSIDTVFLGWVTNSAFDLSYGAAAYTTTTVLGSATPALKSTDIAPDLIDPIYHALYSAPAPFSARYLRITATMSVGFTVGVAAVGLAFVPTWGQEYGAGRPIEDTGTAERLFGGGFGINGGITAGGYQWTFGDLTDAEVRALYALTRKQGITGSTLVVEDPDRTFGLHERIHWGLFDRLEAYERTNPGNTRWNLRIRDWA